ncbi:MAG: hypothetical protein QOF09_2955 [Alphaproteobacteria bacterium]|jgi:hypothetical protein|nr:hypothetical protein [Alphaproteobacteria bacterium]
MSLDMTMATHQAALDAGAEQIAAEAAPAARPWLRDILVMAASGFAVLLSSAFGLLLFLR